MRGKKAKELRKLTKIIFKNLEPVKYEGHKFTKKYLVQTTKGLETVELPHIHIRLGDCQRRRYQLLKRLYKNERGYLYNV